MQTLPLLLEIGVEEIPSGYLSDAIELLQKNFLAQLTKLRLHYEGVRTFYTPRRLAIRIDALQTRQDEAMFERTGPAKRAAFTPEGAPAPALTGFLKSCGATLDDMIVESTPKGEYVLVRRPMPGQDAITLLPGVIAGLIGSITFPKSMHWKDPDFVFARPVRSLVALFGADVIPVEFHGIVSGRISRGNRFLGLDTVVDIPDPAGYEAALESVNVIPDPLTRRERIRTQLAGLFPGGSASVIPDEALLEIVAGLVEHPTAVVADFDPAYLALPEKVITSTLSANQKVFAVQDADGRLSNRFVFISNGNPEFSEIIRAGNQKVVRPRLEDAVFFLSEDLKTPLENLLPQLEEVTFQAKLGTLREKTDRIVGLSGAICEALGLPDDTRARCERAALLCKTDLVTHMIGEKEFTKLQGYIGMEYALRQGEDSEVATALFEHYLPRGQNDKLPNSISGRVVALADKLDTVCGIIGAGMVPTGSADPFALRRAANGVVQILHDGDLCCHLIDLIDFALCQLAPKIGDIAAPRAILRDFFRQRVAWLMKELGVEYDVVDSIAHLELENVPDLVRRACAVQAFKARPDFLRLALGFKRVSNILAQAGFDSGEVDPIHFEHESERGLWDGLNLVREGIDLHLLDSNYPAVLEVLVEYSARIDRFFDDVLVNADDETLRRNRLAMLARIRGAFLEVADLSRLVVEST
jgi:glycyl-tRNA synthetase beta chain